MNRKQLNLFSWVVLAALVGCAVLLVVAPNIGLGLGVFAFAGISYVGVRHETLKLAEANQPTTARRIAELVLASDSFGKFGAGVQVEFGDGEQPSPADYARANLLFDLLLQLTNEEVSVDPLPKA